MLFMPLGVRVCMYIYIYICVYRGVSHVEVYIDIER